MLSPLALIIAPAYWLHYCELIAIPIAIPIVILFAIWYYWYSCITLCVSQSFLYMALLQLIAIQYCMCCMLTAASTYVTIRTSHYWNWYRRSILLVLSHLLQRRYRIPSKRRKVMARYSSQFGGRKVMRRFVSQVAYYQRRRIRYHL
jgi:hypothetical protein